MKFSFVILTIILIVTFQTLKAQKDTLEFNSYKLKNQVALGLSYNGFNGNVSNFTNQGVAFDMNITEGNKKSMYGFNLNIIVSNKLKEFTIPNDYEHYKNPATLIFGFLYAKTFGESRKSHFQMNVGLSYGWLFYRKKGKNGPIGGYDGFVPQCEISYSINIGEPKYVLYDYGDNYTPPKYNPHIRNPFIDFFLGYKQLLLNNIEGEGGILSIGVRYKVDNYYLDKKKNKKDKYFIKY